MENEVKHDPRVSNVRASDNAESSDMAAAEALLSGIFGDTPFFLMIARPDGTGSGSNVETFCNGPLKVMGELLHVIGADILQRDELDT